MRFCDHNMTYYECLGKHKINTICVNLIILNLVSKLARMNCHTICISHKADVNGISVTIIKKSF